MNNKYLRMTELYRSFTDPENDLDFSDKALKEMYDYESKGIGKLDIYTQHNEYLLTGKKVNGFFVGKRWLDITVKMWLEDVKKPGWFFYIEELYKEFPDWFLNKIFKNFLKEKGYSVNNGVFYESRILFK